MACCSSSCSLARFSQRPVDPSRLLSSLSSECRLHPTHNAPPSISCINMMYQQQCSSAPLRAPPLVGVSFHSIAMNVACLHQEEKEILKDDHHSRDGAPLLSLSWPMRANLESGPTGKAEIDRYVGRYVDGRHGMAGREGDRAQGQRVQGMAPPVQGMQKRLDGR